MTAKTASKRVAKWRADNPRLVRFWRECALASRFSPQTRISLLNPNTHMTVEYLLESVREQWQKLGFHPNVTVTFSSGVAEVKAVAPHSAVPTILVPVPEIPDNTSPSSSDG